MNFTVYYSILWFVAIISGGIVIFPTVVQAEWLSDKEIDGLKGPVKSVTVEVPMGLEKFGPKIKRLMTQESHYNEKGERIGGNRSISISNPNSWIAIGSSMHIFDKMGRLSEERVPFLIDGKEKTKLFTHEYEQKDEGIEERIFRFQKTLPEEINTYDANNHITRRKRISYDTAGELAFWEITQYDSKGRISEIDKYDRDGTLIYRSVITYNLDGKEKKILNYGRNGSSNGEIVTSYEPGGSELEIIYDANGEIKYKTTRGFKYDSYGNWISEEENFVSLRQPMSIQSTITKRTITYYPSNSN